jgi:hypothetical protein
VPGSYIHSTSSLDLPGVQVLLRTSSLHTASHSACCSKRRRGPIDLMSCAASPATRLSPPHALQCSPIQSNHISRKPHKPDNASGKTVIAHGSARRTGSARLSVSISASPKRRGRREGWREKETHSLVACCLDHAILGMLQVGREVPAVPYLGTLAGYCRLFPHGVSYLLYCILSLFMRHPTTVMQGRIYSCLLTQIASDR